MNDPFQLNYSESRYEINPGRILDGVGGGGAKFHYLYIITDMYKNTE